VIVVGAAAKVVAEFFVTSAGEDFAADEAVTLRSLLAMSRTQTFVHDFGFTVTFPARNIFQKKKGQKRKARPMQRDPE